MNKSRDPEQVAPYLDDESRWDGGRAEEVVWPEHLDDVREIVTAAIADETPLTVSGGGTGVVAGRIPIGGTVLATERLSRICSPTILPSGEGVMRIGAGVPLVTIEEHLEGSGCFYPPDPTERSAFVGGTLATNASGARSYHYGSTRSWVSALTVVLGDGESLHLERGRALARGGVFECETDSGKKRRFPAPKWALPMTTKHASGYDSRRGMDLIDLMIGSEGTLAVIVEAELRLAPVPEEVISGVLFFDEESDVFSMIHDLRANGDLHPIALEFFDENSLRLMSSQASSLPRNARAALLFEEACSSRRIESISDRWLRSAQRHRADDSSWIAVDKVDRRRILDFRHALPVSVNECLARRGVRKYSTDSAVPWKVFPEMLRRYREKLDQAQVDYVAFGHIGDAHLHFNILPKDESEQALASKIRHELAVIAFEMGGVISAEHGIGKIKRPIFTSLMKPEILECMREIKSAFDPHWILGPGTLIER